MTKGGIFVFSMLLITLIFFVLKACGIFGAPWIWVFCPIWIPLCEIILGVVIRIMIAAFDGKRVDDKDQ